MSKILLSEGQITPSDRLVIELVEALETRPRYCCIGLQRRP